MRYKENDKVTVQSQEWYDQNKQPNGFIIFKDNNKIATFSPGMVKFCGQTFTIGKVVTGSSIYPDHYTFVEDGGAYKWNEEMIAGPASPDAQTYIREAAPVQTPKPEPKPATAPAPKPTPKPEPKPVEKPVEQPKPEPKPTAAPAPKPAPKPEPKPVEKPVEQPKPEPKSVEKPVEQPKPEPKPVEVPEPREAERPDVQEKDETTDSAFETFTILLKPRNGASLEKCTLQAFKIMSNNTVFPSATFDFNGFEITISRK